MTLLSCVIDSGCGIEFHFWKECAHFGMEEVTTLHTSKMSSIIC